MSEKIPVFDPMITTGMPENHRPGRDVYLSAKSFESLPYIYGPKGEFLVGFYTYFRWLDDLIDTPSVPIDQRKVLIDRQKKLLIGEQIEGALLPIEEYFTQLPFDRAAPKTTSDIAEQFRILLGTMEEDLDHVGLWPRTVDEARSYGTRVLMPYAQVISLVLNGHPIASTPEFDQFLTDWCYLGALLHFRQDLEKEKIIKVGFSEEEAQSIRQQPDEDGRYKRILEIFHRMRFREEWKRTLSSFRRGVHAFGELNIPRYQKLISFSYLSLREPLRLPRLFERIEAGLRQA